MIFPAQIMPPHSESWGMEICYDDIGFVSDEVAGDYDYDAVLSILQDDTRDENSWQVENGYPAINPLGWAEPPIYDATHRSLYQAKEIRFDGETEKR